MKKNLAGVVAKIIRRIFDVPKSPCRGVVYSKIPIEQRCDGCGSDFKNTDHRRAEYACILDHSGNCCLLKHAGRKCTKEMKILKEIEKYH